MLVSHKYAVCVLFFALSYCYKTCSMGYELCIFVKNESKFVGN